MKIRSVVNNVFLFLCRHTGRLGVRAYHTKEYYYLRGRWPNFQHPKDLSERILSSMQKKDFLKYASLADKVTAPDYVKSKGLGHILLTHYGAWEDARDIDFDKLPAKFILKPNNGSGGHIYCRDKSKFDKEAAIKALNADLRRGEDYSFEPHYKHIRPMVLCEELLDLGEGKVLTDYKFTCINGKIADVFLAGENSRGERKYATVDTDWNILPYTKPEYMLDPLPSKPAKIKEMVEYAQILSSDFPFVRVDFYEYERKVYFSELTFSPWGGFMYSYTNEAIDKLGSLF